MKLSTTLTIICIMMLLISCASIGKNMENNLISNEDTTQSPFWEVDIDSFMDYVAEKEVADFEGIWDIGGNYIVGVLRDGSGYIGFTLESVYADWLPRMVKFKIETFDDSTCTTWYMRDFSIEIYNNESVLLMDNLLVVGGSQLKRLDSKFPDSQFDLSVDAEYIVKMVEEIHPIFIMEGMLGDDYEELRAEYLETTKSLSSIEEFNFATAGYFVSLKDGHMNLLQLSGDYIDIELVYQDKRLFISDEDSSHSEIEVLEIGGISVANLLDVIEKHFYFENETARIILIPWFIRYEMILLFAEVEILESKTVLITLSENGIQRTVEYTIASPAQEYIEQQSEPIIRHEMIDDIFYIKLTLFIDGDHITPVVEEIEKAIENGIWRFILDLRGNPGGTTDVAERLFEAMGITQLPPHGGLLRISERVREVQAPYGIFYDDVDNISFSPNTESDNPNKVFISVLTDAYSMSSSHWTGAKVQDGKLGNIIGEPSMNAPSSFGAVFPNYTPIANLTIMVSATWFMRPDANADQNTLMPDILVPAEEALETALEYLRGLERGM